VIDGFFHRLDHLGVLAHAEIVVRTPDGYFLLAIGRVARCARKIAAMAFQIGKNAVTAFSVKPIQLVFEKRFEIHHMLQFVRLFVAETATARQPLVPALSSTAAKGADF
jgi:hypothetical protein